MLSMEVLNFDVFDVVDVFEYLEILDVSGRGAPVGFAFLRTPFERSRRMFPIPLSRPWSKLAKPKGCCLG